MFQVDAFSNRVFGGNPAAVVILDDWLPGHVMQAVAAENNLAETAFARPNETGWDLRWFTPANEADFCGHATLATAHVLVTQHAVRDCLRFSTRVGELRVFPEHDGYRLDVPCLPPQPLHELPESVAGMFANTSRGIFRNFENVFVELEDETAVRAFIPDLREIKRLGAVSLAITAKGASHDFVSRYFAPGTGIPEDPVTGSIHATLVPYWAAKLGKNHLSAYQASERGGHLICELAGDRVFMTGQATTFMKAEIYIPSS